MNDTYINLKMKQIIDLEGLDELTAQSDWTESVENVELNRSGWVYDGIAGMSIDLCSDVTKGERSFGKLPVKD